jgi:cobyrinic acid a,c-diamide synthase
VIGLVVGGVASGVGKTTLTLGLIGALRRRGLAVQPFKVGPDYIDPSHHTQAAGRTSRNLDSWLLPEPALRELFARAARVADAAIVEGVMGLFDGRSGEGETGSTAQVAKLLGLPVVLVVDAGKAARSVAATVLGFQSLDPDLRMVGVVLNNVSGERHAELGREAVEELARVSVLGWLPRDAELRQEERNLGLVPAAERRVPERLLGRAAAQVERHLDLDRLCRLAQIEPPAAGSSALFPAEALPVRARIAVARDEAFSFYYQDNLDLLTAYGAELAPFSPLRDPALPGDVGGVYLGGGFPELFATELAANAPMLASMRAAAVRGLPIYAECGGLMYLQERLVDPDDRPHVMAGLLPGASALTKQRLTLGYREVRARQASALLPAGRLVRGHEFHWSVADPPPPGLAAYDIVGEPGRVEGFAVGSVLASYVHLHFGSEPALARRFVEACSAPRREAASPPPGTSSAPPRTASRPESRPEPSRDGQLRARTLLRRHGLPPDEIEALSRRRIDELIGHRLPPSEPERGLVARLVYAAGDPELVERVTLRGEPIEVGISALTRDGRLVVDVGMVAAGISRASLAGVGVTNYVAIQARGAARLAEERGITRSAAGILALGLALDGAVVAIGNAPTALLALLDLAADGAARPALVVGMPVGFVAAEDAKDLLLASGLPAVVVQGTRGGSALAAATVNYLLRLAVERRSAAGMDWAARE